MTELNASCPIEPLNGIANLRTAVDVLRLDLLHPVISGNKWFKLKFYLLEAIEQKKTVLTFGGAFSNHIVATAAAASYAGLQSIGIIRGERAPVLSHTLLHAQAFGMTLYFTSRELYNQKKVPDELLQNFGKDNLFIIPEGGYGENGRNGAKTILQDNRTSGYSHIISAVGTGTTLAGLTAAAGLEQKIIGIPVLKNCFSLQNEIQYLLPADCPASFELHDAYHFGGYAKKSSVLFHFMNEFYKKTGIPTDFVYTAKAFYAALDLLQRGYFSPADKLLLLHTGGLQGNLSLPKGTLIFS